MGGMTGLRQRLPLAPFSVIRLWKRHIHACSVHNSEKLDTQPPVVVYGRLDVEESDSTKAQDYFKNEEFKAKKNPGRFEIGKVNLPEVFLESVKRILRNENVKDIEEQSKILSRYLHARHLPIENDEYRAKVQFVEEEILAKDSHLEPFLSAAQKAALDGRRETKIRNQLKKRIYHWEALNFTHSTALQYLAAQIPAQYAALSRVFYEISVRDPDFQPTTLFDFGSGLGSVLWAAQTYWSKSLVENMCVDASKEMLEIAELICKNGISTGKPVFPGVYFRQFLSATTDRKYNLVASSYSLMELPSAKNRIETIDNLWKKTNQYLVLVEPGSNAGFEALNEARDYILRLDDEETDSRVARGHIFSPCPHDTDCPRYSSDKTPCNFSVRYRPLLPFHQDETQREIFSYLVFKKGARKGNAEQWPRVVREPICRHHHVICRLCTKHGVLSETVITKGKHTRPLYRCAKKLTWGDLLPVQDKQIADTDEEKEAEAPESASVSSGSS